MTQYSKRMVIVHWLTLRNVDRCMVSGRQPGRYDRREQGDIGRIPDPYGGGSLGIGSGVVATVVPPQGRHATEDQRQAGIPGSRQGRSASDVCGAVSVAGDRDIDHS